MISRCLVDIFFCFELAFFCIGPDFLDSCLLAAYTPVCVYSG